MQSKTKRGSWATMGDAVPVQTTNRLSQKTGDPQTPCQVGSDPCVEFSANLVCSKPFSQRQRAFWSNSCKLKGRLPGVGDERPDRVKQNPT